MPGTSFDSDSDFDPQDQAEVLDETHYDEEENAQLRTFEELPDVLDVTTAIGDRDDDEALALDADEFDEEAFSDEDLEEDNELDYRATAEDDVYDDADSNDIVDDFDDDRVGSEEIEGLREVRDADEVSGGEDDFTNFQAKAVGDEDLRRMGYLDDADNPGANPARRG